MQPLRFFSIFILALTALMLTGCLIPETFDAKIHITRDGGYTFEYDGILAYGPALNKMQKGPLTAEDENKLRHGTVNLKWPPEFKTVSYEGNGRYRVHVQKQGSPGEDYTFLNRDIPLVSIAHEKDGSMTIRSRQTDEKTLKLLKTIGAGIEGHVTLSVDGGLKVLEHNADRAPRFFGLFGDYEWQLNSYGDRLLMILN